VQGSVIGGQQATIAQRRSTSLGRRCAATKFSLPANTINFGSRTVGVTKYSDYDLEQSRRCQPNCFESTLNGAEFASQWANLPLT